MSEVLDNAAADLHRALSHDGERIDISWNRSTVEEVAALIDEHKRTVRGIVVDHDGEVSPTQAAALLGMSRPVVRRLMDDGKLEFRMVGSHHRISVASIDAFRKADRARRKTALADLAELQNELGLIE